MPEISVILSTARDDYSIIGCPDLHVLAPTLMSLEYQKFKDFELIIVDALYPKRREWMETFDFSYPIKYVPPHPNHSFWIKHKRWNVAGMLNTGLLYAEGELVVRIDDASEFDDDFLLKMWEGYQSGFFPLAMHIRYHAGKPARVDAEYLEKGYEAKYAEMPNEDRAILLKKLYGDEGIVRDTRYRTVKEKGGRMIAPSHWYYGYSSASLEALLKVNGWDEKFDGLKSLEDSDLGNRLYMAGYKDMFLLDINYQVIEHEHLPISIIDRNVKTFKCNYGLYLWNDKRKMWRANSYRLTLEDCKWIREHICPSCNNYQRCQNEELKGRFYIDNEDFRLWLNNQNIFDLREERMMI